MAPFLRTVASPLDSSRRWIGSIGDIFSVYQENLRLKDERAKLMQWQSRARELEDRIKRYQLLLHAVPDPELGKLVVRVIGRANHPFQQTMILDAGKANGIKPGQAVVDARGMIGRIFLTGDRTAWVIPLTDLNSRVPVTIEPSETQAIMAGNNSRMPVLDALAHNAEIKPGDQVVSSGDGDILPAGLLIGIIVMHGKEYRVALFSDQSMAQDVEILNFKQAPEKPPQPTLADLPVTAAGLPPALPPPPPVVAPQNKSADTTGGAGVTKVKPANTGHVGNVGNVGEADDGIE